MAFSNIVLIIGNDYIAWETLYCLIPVQFYTIIIQERNVLVYSLYFPVTELLPVLGFMGLWCPPPHFAITLTLPLFILTPVLFIAWNVLWEAKRILTGTFFPCCIIILHLPGFTWYVCCFAVPKGAFQSPSGSLFQRGSATTGGNAEFFNGGGRDLCHLTPSVCSGGRATLIKQV